MKRTTIYRARLTREDTAQLRQDESRTLRMGTLMDLISAECASVRRPMRAAGRV